MPLTEEQLMLQDAVLTGTGFMRGLKRICPEDLQAEPMTATEAQARTAEKMSKVSSPELASLAAKYVNINDQSFVLLGVTDAVAMAADVRRLAASVLAQAEGNPRK